MKHIGKFVVLGAVLVASASSAFAANITLGSFGSTAGLYNPGPISVDNSEMMYVAKQTFTTDTVGCTGGNSYCLPAMGALTPTGGFAVDLSPVSPSIWANALPNSTWVGINANAGPQSTINPAFGYYEFQTTFTGAAGYAGTLSVFADDTVEVLLTNLNGTSVVVPAGAFGSDAHCADNTPNCSANASGLVNATAGSNILTFYVSQAGLGPAGGNNDPSGFDFNATLSPTPEPSSLMLLGSGLVGAAGMFFRRRVTA